MITPEQSSHWYSKEGKPAYGAGMVQARKEGLLPSVTSILQVIGKPGLDAWKQNQILEAAAECPLGPGESVEDWASHVHMISQEKSKIARENGTLIHDAIEDFIKGKSYFVPYELRPSFESACKVIEDNLQLDTATTEATAINSDDGYGGRVDFRGQLVDGKPTIVDFKTQFVKGKPTVYSTYRYQLAAYAGCMICDDNGYRTHLPLEIEAGYVLANIIISTNPDYPGAWWEPMGSVPVRKGWDAKLWDTYAGAWEGFVSALRLWRLENNYANG